MTVEQLIQFCQHNGIKIHIDPISIHGQTQFTLLDNITEMSRQASLPNDHHMNELEQCLEHCVQQLRIDITNKIKKYKSNGISS